MSSPSTSVSSDVSVVIITKNEAHNIDECLACVGWAKEVIVVDSGSTDRTVEIAAAHGAKVIQTPDWPGFGPQKNRALAAASCVWVLSIDADERVTPSLRQVLEEAIMRDVDVAYASPRLTYFLGKPVRHGGWYPDMGVRLFKRGRARFSDHLVHEGLMVDVPVQVLHADLLHYSYRTRDDVFKKIEAYGDAGARQLIQARRKVAWGAPELKAGWAWFRTWVIRAGWLDGRAGWDIASMNARTTLLKYRLARRALRHDSHIDPH